MLVGVGEIGALFAGKPDFLNTFTGLNHLDPFFIFNASSEDVIFDMPEVSN